jgi:hypothetical protein
LYARLGGRVTDGVTRHAFVAEAVCRGVEECDDGRFAGTDRWPGSRTLDEEEAA